MRRIPYDQREARIRAAFVERRKRKRKRRRKLTGEKRAAFQRLATMMIDVDRRAERRGLAAGLLADGVCCRETEGPCRHEGNPEIEN